MIKTGKIEDVEAGEVRQRGWAKYRYWTYTFNVKLNGRWLHLKTRGQYTNAAQARKRMTEKVEALRRLIP